MLNKFPFHNVSLRSWPFLVSVVLVCMLIRFVGGFHSFLTFSVALTFIFLLIVIVWRWWADVSEESSSGFHKKFIINKFYVGMVLMIISEIFFFASFFWAFFHKCWFPGKEVGGVWPPNKIKEIAVDTFSIPFLKTVILLSSGITVTWSHHRVLLGRQKNATIGLGITILLGVLFLLLQNFEYLSSFFGFKSLVFGSCFYMLTGFHGGHVIVGTVFLTVCFYRFLSLNFNPQNHVSFELAIWYWHFVDVVWLFLFLFVYWYRRI